MAIMTDDKSINALLNGVTDEESTVDKVIEIFNGISSNVLSNYAAHPFFVQHVFPRLEQILQEWIDVQVTLSTDNSATFHHISHLILRLSKSMSDQLQNSKSLIGIIKKCLNNISSYGYHINESQSGENSNIASFDCLIQAYTEIE